MTGPDADLAVFSGGILALSAFLLISVGVFATGGVSADAGGSTRMTASTMAGQPPAERVPERGTRTEDSDAVVLDPVAACSVSSRTVAPGENVTLDASASENASDYQFDEDQSGSFGEFSERSFETVSYDEPGNYTPRVKVWEYPSEQNDTVDCPTVRVERNQPPTANLTYYPEPAIENRTVTLDASNSTDPDGSIELYRWDLDGDGFDERNTTEPRLKVSYRYDPPAGGPGYANVGVTVVDDDGNTGRDSVDLEIVREPPVARCSVTPSTVQPGETAVLDASGSENARTYEFDTDGDPAYDTDRLTVERVNVSFAEPGNYTLGVIAYGENGDRTNETDCSVTVNERPNAAFSVTPRPVVAGGVTTLNASASSDPDGQIARYEWDFDGDGTVDLNTTDPVVTHQFPYDTTSPGLAVVGLTVVDDLGGEGRTGADLEVVRPDLEAACRVSPTTVVPGQSVTIEVDAGPRIDQFQYDEDSTGEFGPFTEQPTDTVEYAEPGEYRPRVKVWNASSEQSRVVECDTVTVREENTPPDASLTYTPSTPAVGETVTFDASASADPDGRITRYEWDFDGDGTADRTTAGPTVTHSFGGATDFRVGVTVVDDDNATGRAERTVSVGRPLDAACSVSTRDLEPGEELRVSVDASNDVDRFQYDRGDGEFTESTERSIGVLTYEEPGNYTPRVRVLALPSERTLVVECPSVEVREENAPPVASFTVSPSGPGPDDTVTFDASGSTDPDGQIVQYRWDFDGDGTVDATSSDPTITQSFASEGSRSVELVVVDERGATAQARNDLEVSGPLLPFPWWWIPLGLLGLSAAGYGLRKFPKPKPKPGSTRHSGRNYAMGTFETPTSSETVAVSGVGFEPNVVLFRVANRVQAPPDESGSDGEGTATGDAATDGGTGAARTGRSTGLSIGSAARTGSGLEQNVVSVADDAESVDTAVGATHSGKAIDVLVHGDDHVGSLAGSVQKFTEDGFHVDFDASKLPEGEDRGYVVHYQAFALDDVSAIDIGHFSTATGTGTQTVDLEVDADYVALTACTLGQGVNSGETGSAVGVSHGEAVTVPVESDQESHSPPDRVDQQTVGGAVGSGGNGPGLLCGHDDRLLHLPFLDDEGVVGRTSARLRQLGKRLELTYDAIYAPDGATQVVTYLAMEAGEGLRPELGHVRVPAPGASRAVDVGFDPGMVALTGVDVERIGVDESVSNAVPFEWSYGVAMPTVGGDTAEQVLHGSLVTDPIPHPDTPGLGAIDPVHAGVTKPRETRGVEPTPPESPDGVAAPETEGDGGTARSHASTGDHSGPRDLPSSRGAAAAVLTTGDGAIRSRDEVTVSAFTRKGFEVSTYDVHTFEDPRRGERRGVLFYTAWPKPKGPDRQTSVDDEGDES